MKTRTYRTHRPITDELRASVLEDLPEINDIQDPDLRRKAVEAWAYSLSGSSFARIRDVPGEGNPGQLSLVRGAQPEHLRGVARMAMDIVDQFTAEWPEVKVDRDIVLCGALCHDVGKPYEYSPANQKRWKENPGASGFPAIRHSLYGVHICLTVGLPEAVAHTAGAHSREGNFILRSLENTIVYFADHAFWAILERAGRLEPLADGRVVT